MLTVNNRILPEGAGSSASSSPQIQVPPHRRRYAPETRRRQIQRQLLDDRSKESDKGTATDPDVVYLSSWVAKTSHLLGSGTDGRVYKGFFVTDNKPLAIKIGKNVRKECDVLYELNHSNIIELYHSLVTPSGETVCVMEYCNGGCLDDFIYSNPTAVATLAFHWLLIEIVDALIYLHSLGYIHMDIKGSNVLLSMDPEKKTIHAKLADFGYATRKRAKMPCCGTKINFSPEVCKYWFGKDNKTTDGAILDELERQRKYDESITPAVDVYSFGIMLARLLNDDECPYTLRPSTTEINTDKDQRWWDALERADKWQTLDTDQRLFQVDRNVFERAYLISPVYAQVINMCVNYDYKQRATFEQVKQVLMARHPLPF